MMQDFGLRRGVNHWAHITVSIGGVAHHQSLHCAKEHFLEFRRDIALHIEHPQGGATLSSRLKCANKHIPDRLF